MMPKQTMNWLITPKGPARLGGQISLMNIGEITEKDPALAPMTNLPAIIAPKLLISEIPTPITKTTLIINKAFFLPKLASLLPQIAPRAAPRGAAVPIIELVASQELIRPSYVGINVVKKL